MMCVGGGGEGRDHHPEKRQTDHGVSSLCYHSYNFLVSHPIGDPTPVTDHHSPLLSPTSWGCSTVWRDKHLVFSRFCQGVRRLLRMHVAVSNLCILTMMYMVPPEQGFMIH